MPAFGTLFKTQLCVLQDFGMQLLLKYERNICAKTVYLFDHSSRRSKKWKLQLAPLNSALKDTECRCRFGISSCIYQNFDTFLSIKYENTAVSSIEYLWMELELDNQSFTFREPTSKMLNWTT